MSKSLVPSEDAKPVQLSPEDTAVCESYIHYKGNVTEVARELQMPKQDVIAALNEPLAKQYLDTMFLSHGHLSRYKLAEMLNDILEKKLEEYEEAEIPPDIKLDKLLDIMLKLRDQEIKQLPKKEEVRNQTNVQINGGQNYMDLVSKLIE